MQGFTWPTQDYTQIHTSGIEANFFCRFTKRLAPPPFPEKISIFSTGFYSHSTFCLKIYCKVVVVLEFQSYFRLGLLQEQNNDIKDMKNKLEEIVKSLQSSQ